jgi:sugar phosphate permease
VSSQLGSQPWSPRPIQAARYATRVAIAPVLQNPRTLALSAAEIGNAASAYVIGAVAGALIFGWLSPAPDFATISYGGRRGLEPSAE